MIDLIYEWNEQEYAYLLFKLEEGQKYFEEKFCDLEDLLIYVEKHYTLARLIVRGEEGK